MSILSYVWTPPANQRVGAERRRAEAWAGVMTCDGKNLSRTLSTGNSMISLAIIPIASESRTYPQKDINPELHSTAVPHAIGQCHK